MSPKVDKLSQTIINLQIFFDKEDNSTREDLANVSHQLAQLNKTLSRNKLTIQIVSQELAIAEAALAPIDAQKELKGFFQLKFDNIPKIPQQNACQELAYLKFKSNLENPAGLPQQIELKSNREYSIGRSPESDVTFDGKLFGGVSWSHAGILPCIKRDKETQWQIYDRHSTNGTFVNGQQVKNARLLNSGDVITLASPQSGKKVAELVFNIQIEASNSLSDRKYWDIVDCDLLMVVVDSKQQLAPEVKDFIQRLDRTFIHQQFLLINSPNSQQGAEIADDIASNLNSIESWIENELEGQEIELISLCLEPDRTKDSQEKLDSRQLKKQKQFVKILSNIIRRHPEDILAKRIAMKMVRIVEPTKPFLRQQQQRLVEGQAEEEQKLESVSQINLKETTKSAVFKANQIKERFFKQIKIDINQSKAALLDSYSKKSINYKIKKFVDDLTPVLLSKNGQKVVRLNDDSRNNGDDINASLIDFCTDLLQKWATAECYKVVHIYDDGGLQGLEERLNEQTKIDSETASKSLFSALENVNVQEIFTLSFAGINCETSYRQKSLGTYIMKQLRSQMMQVMMALTVASSLVGITLNKNEIIQNLSSYFKQYPWLFGLFMAGAIFLLIKAYNSENDLKLEEVGDKLKKDLSNYYQSFSKNLLDKVIQEITLKLDSENQKISDGLKTMSQYSEDRMVEIARQKNQIKKNIEQYKAQQKELSAGLSELEKLKQI